MAADLRTRRWTPWAGLFVGFAAWAAHHQVGSDLVYLRCQPEDRWLVVALGVACALAAAGAGWLSWVSRNVEAEGPTHETRQFIAWISAAGAGLFTFAILLQIAAGVAAPLCAL